MEMFYLQSTNQKEEVNVKKLYGKESTLTKEEFIKEYNINENGLSTQEAVERIHKYGYNEIKSAKQKKWYNYLIESLFTPFNSILLRYCCNSFLHRCISTRKTKLCKYNCNFCSSCRKYFIRIF